MIVGTWRLHVITMRMPCTSEAWADMSHIARPDVDCECIGALTRMGASYVDILVQVSLQRMTDHRASFSKGCPTEAVPKAAAVRL
mmetsp:Transcript_3634/g.7092  ORF Transcript_3634/g.7092 Transcript_3634/m.7092 type:complete len:85 (-) Transcript_3634:139-393(-)